MTQADSVFPPPIFTVPWQVEGQDHPVALTCDDEPEAARQAWLMLMTLRRYGITAPEQLSEHLEGGIVALPRMASVSTSRQGSEGPGHVE